MVHRESVGEPEQVRRDGDAGRADYARQGDGFRGHLEPLQLPGDGRMLHKPRRRGNMRYVMRRHNCWPNAVVGRAALDGAAMVDAMSTSSIW